MAQAPSFRLPEDAYVAPVEDAAFVAQFVAEQRAKLGAHGEANGGPQK